MTYLPTDAVFCSDHEFIDLESLYHWIGNSYIFYYSCENCTKCNNCNRFSYLTNKKH